MRKTIYTPEQDLLRTLIKEVRAEAGLTQQDLALLLGWRQSVVSNIERGERRVDLLELRQICWAVGLPLDEFLRRLDARLLALEGPQETRLAERAELLAELARMKAGQDEALRRLEARREELQASRQVE